MIEITFSRFQKDLQVIKLSASIALQNSLVWIFNTKNPLLWLLQMFV